MSFNYSITRFSTKVKHKLIRKIISRLSIVEKAIDASRQMDIWEEKDLIRVRNIDLPRLSKEVECKIKSFWKQNIHKSIHSTYFRTIVYLLGCEPNDLHLYISPYIMNVLLSKVLNPPSAANTLSEKILFPLLFPIVKQPRIIIGYYHHSYISGDFTPISSNLAIETILNYGKPIIIKPSIDSHGGNNVTIFKDYDEKTLRKIFTTYQKKNFIIQEVIEQSAEMAIFNPSSLNTIRITTLLMNGKCSLLSKMLRHGGPGMIVDNMTSGGFGVGIKDDGSITFATSDTDGLRKDVHITGFRYDSRKIPNFPSICKTAIQLHQYTPQCCVID